MEIKERASYLEFKEIFSPMGCFTLQQVASGARLSVSRNTIGRWVKEHKLIRLKQNVYTFPEYLRSGDAQLYFANKMYQPSYISIHSALAFWGMIPEAVVQVTSVSSRKTAYFTNEFGQFTYHTIRSSSFFGYTIESSAFHPSWGVHIAYPEKAILDLLYLYPQYHTIEDMLGLRLDLDILKIDRLTNYTEQYGVESLKRRVEKLREAYRL